MSNITCHFVHQIASVVEQCEFVRTNESCEYEGILYSYVQLAYCQFGGALRPLSIVILIAILLMLFLAIGVVADDFLCPSLLSVSDTFKLPEHIAGVTFLAIGNAANDIFSSISGISQSKPHLVFSSLYGSGIFIATVVTGTVLFTGQFAIKRRPIVRDILFYMLAASLVWLFIYQGKLTLVHSILLMSLYVIYIIVVIAGRTIYVRIQKMKAKKQQAVTRENTIQNRAIGASAMLSINIMDVEQQQSDANQSTIQSTQSLPMSFAIGPMRRHSLAHGLATHSQGPSAPASAARPRTLSYEDEMVYTRFHRRHPFGPIRRRSNTMHYQSNTLGTRNMSTHQNLENIFHVTSEHIHDEQQKRKLGYINEIDLSANFEKTNGEIKLTEKQIPSNPHVDAVVDELKEFLIEICPINIFEWNEYKWYSKVMAVIKAAPYLIMDACIPIVDMECERNNWCRLIICLNMFCAPQACLILLQIDYDIGGVFPLWATFLIFSLVIANVILWTSERAQPPKYHSIFGFIGFGMSIIFTNAIAQEVVAVLTALGIVFNLSDAILGLTVLAWGNSIGDLMADYSLAKQGYPGIAISACFGGSMINLVMGIGLPYTVFLIEEETSKVAVNYTAMITLLFSTTIVCLLVTLGFFLYNRFNSSKIHGIVLLGIYSAYVAAALVIEFTSLS